MPAIRTDGFNAGVMPQVQFANPQLLVPQYGNILPSIGQGFGLANQIQSAPIQQQQQQVQLQEAQGKLAQLPVEQKLQQIKLALASQPVDSTESVRIVNVPRLGGDKLQPMTDEDGNQILDANGQPQMENIAGSAPVDQMVQSHIKQVNPLTTNISYEDRNTKVEKTAEQMANEAAYGSYRTDLGNAALNRASRSKQFEYSDVLQKYQDAVDAGDSEAAQLYKDRLTRLNAQPGQLPSGTIYERNLEKMSVDAGIPLDVAKELVKTPDGARVLSNAAAINKQKAKAFSLTPNLSPADQATIDIASKGAPTTATNHDGVDPQIADLVRSIGGGAPVPAKPSPGAPTSFDTLEQANAAGASGLLKPGTKIIVGGRPATWQ